MAKKRKPTAAEQRLAKLRGDLLEAKRRLYALLLQLPEEHIGAGELRLIEILPKDPQIQAYLAKALGGEG